MKYVGVPNFTPEEIEFISADEKDAPKYVFSTDRKDPFNLVTLRFNIDNNKYSKFLNKEIENLQEACAHASYTARQWKKEDSAIAASRRKEKNKLYQKTFRNKQIENNPQVEIARQNWKNAVSQRNELMRQWDEHVAKLRKQYNEIKSAMESGELNDN